MGLTKPPFFQWPVAPVASRGLGGGETPPAASDLSGWHIPNDGVGSDIRLTMQAPIVADPAAFVCSFAYWLKIIRTDPPPEFPDAQFFEIIELQQTGVGHSRWQWLWLSGSTNPDSNNGVCVVDGSTDGIADNRHIAAAFRGQFLTESEDAATVLPQDSYWTHILGVIDSGPGHIDPPLSGVIYVNGQQTGYAREFGLADFPFIGAASITPSIGKAVNVPPGTDDDGLNGDIGEIWLAVGQDLRDVNNVIPDATIAKFLRPGNVPVYLGDNGELPTGTPPQIYLSRRLAEPIGATIANRGTGADFDVVGAVTPSEDFVPAAFPMPGPEPRPLPYSWDVTGALNVGETLTIVDGAARWAGGPLLTLAYQWMNGGVYEGADQATFVSLDVDETYFTNCFVTVTNAAGSFVANSISVGPILPPTSAGLRITADDFLRVTADGNPREAE